MNLPDKIQQIMSYPEFLKLMIDDKGALRAPLSSIIFFVLMGALHEKELFSKKPR
jgi:hypothetical protein